MDTATVVGSGIIGLSTAITLQERGLSVRIVSKEDFTQTVSHRVGAIWFPYAIKPVDQANKWAKISYQKYTAETMAESGVSMLQFMVVYDEESNHGWIDQLPKGAVKKANRRELPLGIKNAHVATVPLIEPPTYLRYLMHKFEENSGRFEKASISSLKELATLDSLIVNCSGLGAKQICQDDALYPVRGQILKCDKLDEVSMVDSTKKGHLLYIINRSTDCVVGGTDYDHDWNERVDIGDTAKILERLRKAGFDDSRFRIKETVVGLRPMRTTVRCEQDAVFQKVFHNYGHGGAGFTVAWGCAQDIASMIQ